MNMPLHTILVVDDDALQRMHVAERLLDAGYEVLEAENTDAAICIFERHSEVRLLFTDVEMPPGADGIVLAQIVEQRWPNVLLLVTSGGVDLTDDDVPDGGAFVAKPYRAGDLLARVASLISSLCRRGQLPDPTGVCQCKSAP